MTDLKFALRQLLKNPGFTAVAVFTLALGIGATTAIFSVVYGVLIDPYPYAHPEKIWAPGVKTARNQQVMRPYRKDEFEAMAAMSGFEDVMATAPGGALLAGDFAARDVTAPKLSANAFHFLGVAPVLGRTFGPGDYSAGGMPEPVTVISYNLWQQLFAGELNVLNKTVRLDDNVYTIIGVMPPRFGWWTSDGLWLPLDEKSDTSTYVFPIARLKPGVTPAVARQQLQGLQMEFAKNNPGDFPKDAFETTLTNYLEITAASGEMAHTLQLLFVAVAFLLLIACANIANLQLARATGRMKEMAIRLAIGAGRLRLVRQLLAESVLLSALGGVLGLALAMAITKLVVILLPQFSIPNESRIEVNGHVLFFCIAISLVTGIAFGLVPALQSARPNLSGTLKDERTSTGSVGSGRVRSSLVIVQVAMCVVLLISAGLTVRSFLALARSDLGFRPENLVTVNISMPSTRYDTLAKRNQFSAEVLERTQHIPGVEAAQIGNGSAPFGGPKLDKYTIDGQPGGETLAFNLVSDGYWKAMGIGLRRGRMIDADDVRHGNRVAVINESAAKLWPGSADPLGRTIRADILESPPGSVFVATNISPDITVIGICADARNNGLANQTQPAVFIPFTVVAPPGRTLAIRAHAPPAVIFKAVEEQIAAIDPLAPVGYLQTAEQLISEQTSQPRFTMALFSLFAAAGLTLATVGLFSVLSYLVSRRTREIGVRMALGAQRNNVLALVLKDGTRMAGLGILIGSIASLGATRVLSSQIALHQAHSIDPLSFVAVISILGLAAIVACWLPARRAAMVNPTEALRNE
ncbi:FtsX-like permease family protein [bacterium]|nr:FtsX-like permease family protein [bacterium]